jgi:hypothetical protein
MSFKDFLETTDPAMFDKLAEEAQVDLITKLTPLFDKCAEYTADLILRKIAETVENQATVEKEEEKVGNKEEQKENKEEEVKEDKEAVNEEEVIPTDPATANKSNEIMDPSLTPGGLKAQDVKDAVDEAIAVGQADQILPFCKALAEQYPEAFQEVVKMVKIELHDGVMKKLIEPDAAISITDQLNAMLGE